MTAGSTDERGIKTQVSAETYQAFVDILHHELVVATGCTEPIAVAYASALATKTLGSEPDRCVAAVSGNIIKNVNSVTVPNTGGMRGVKASVAAGVTVGNSDNLLDVLGDVDDDGRVRIQEYLSNHEIKVKIAETDEPFYVSIHAYAGDDFAHVIMDKSHTNVAFVAKNGEVILDAREDGTAETERTREYLNLADIVAFAEHANLETCAGSSSVRSSTTAPSPRRV